MEKGLVANETAQDLPEQFSIVGSGAQYAVAMLTGPEIAHQEIVTKPHDPAPRVIKIPLSTNQVALAVDRLDIPEDQHAAKVEMLVRSRVALGLRALDLAAQDPFVYLSFGRPHGVLTDYRQPDINRQYELYVMEQARAIRVHTEMPLYSQDYAPSIDRYISSEPCSREGRVLRCLIDRYALLQTRLIKHGFLDDIFKLSNYGWRSNELRVNDFSELQLKPHHAAEAIRQRKWEDVVSNKDYTQMHPTQQDYFNDTLQRTLPPRIIDTWGTELPNILQSSSVLFAQDIVERRYIERIMKSFGDFQG